jgi:hypothetical protein
MAINPSYVLCNQLHSSRDHILPEGFSRTGAEVRVFVQVRDTPAPVSLEGPAASYHLERPSASKITQVFLTFGRTL